MVTITADISSETLQELEQLSKENHRELNREVAYRLDQAIRYKTHLSDDDVGLFKVLSRLYEVDEGDEDQNLMDHIKKIETPLN